MWCHEVSAADNASAVYQYRPLSKSKSVLVTDQGQLGSGAEETRPQVEELMISCYPQESQKSVKLLLGAGGGEKPALWQVSPQGFFLFKRHNVV